MLLQLLMNCCTKIFGAFGNRKEKEMMEKKKRRREKRMMMMENSEWEENLERGIRKRTGEGNGDANDALISHLVPVEYVRCSH